MLAEQLQLRPSPAWPLHIGYAEQDKGAEGGIFRTAVCVRQVSHYNLSFYFSRIPSNLFYPTQVGVTRLLVCHHTTNPPVKLLDHFQGTRNPRLQIFGLQPYFNPTRGEKWGHDPASETSPFPP